MSVLHTSILLRGSKYLYLVQYLLSLDVNEASKSPRRTKNVSKSVLTGMVRLPDVDTETSVARKMLSKSRI